MGLRWPSRISPKTGWFLGNCFLLGRGRYIHITYKTALRAIRRFGEGDEGEAGQQAGDQAGEQTGEQAGEHAGEQASGQADEQAGEQGSRRASRQVSKQESR